MPSSSRDHARPPARPPARPHERAGARSGARSGGGPADRRIREEAADWALRLEDADCGPRERRALEAWLARDPAHAAAFARARRALGESALAFAEDPAAARRALGGRDVGRHGGHDDGHDGGHDGGAPGADRRRAGRAPLAAAAGLLILLGAAFLALDGPMRLMADARSGPGETPEIALPDGSTLRLNGGSAVALDYSAARRRVVLLRGQALFEVARDPGRPFVVEAGEGRAEALGTVFDVNRLPGRAEVTVIESRVRVDTPAGARELGAGMRLAYDAEGALGPVVPVPPEAAAAWRDGRLVAEDRPLAEVAAALDRRLPGRLVVLDGGARRVSGSFDLSRPAAAVEALAAAFNLRVMRAGPWLTVLR